MKHLSTLPPPPLLEVKRLIEETVRNLVIRLSRSSLSPFDYFCNEERLKSTAVRRLQEDERSNEDAFPLPLINDSLDSPP